MNSWDKENLFVQDRSAMNLVLIINLQLMPLHERNDGAAQA